MAFISARGFSLPKGNAYLIVRMIVSERGCTHMRILMGIAKVIYTELSYRIIECHISCDLCSEGGPMNCTSCPAGTCLCPSTPNGSEGVCVTSCQLCSYAATNTYFLSNKCLGIYIYIYIYLVCDPTCNECLGPSSTECTSCYSPTSFCETGFSGNGTCIDRCDTQCVRNTRHTYVENEICLICHFDCNYCQPPGDLNSCNNCSSLVFDQLCQDVTLGIGHCLDVCDTCILNSRHTYADISKLQCLGTLYIYIYIYICIECHPLCDLCATSSTNCSTCRVHPKGYIEHIPAGSSHCWCIKGSFYEADVTEDCQGIIHNIYIYSLSSLLC